jgi:hypothetical protein
MRKIKYLMIFTLTVLTSCIGLVNSSDFEDEEEKAMNSWLGSKKSTLILQWGPPTRTQSDGDGGQILIYDSSPMSFQEKPGRIYRNQNGSIGYTSPTSSTVVRMRMFYVRENGQIYHWRAQGRVE